MEVEVASCLPFAAVPGSVFAGEGYGDGDGDGEGIRDFDPGLDSMDVDNVSDSSVFPGSPEPGTVGGGDGLASMDVVDDSSTSLSPGDSGDESSSPVGDESSFSASSGGSCDSGLSGMWWG